MPPKKDSSSLPSSKNNEMINFYELPEIKKKLPKYWNPHFNETQMKIPFRCGLIGASGTGKTSWLCNFLAKAQDTFGYITVVYKSQEPLYEYLEKKITGKYIKFYTKLSELPMVEMFGNKDKQQLLVFDDQVNEKNQEIIKEYCIRCRKHGQGVSVLYLSQSFFKIPKLVRQQFNYLILFKLSSNRDLRLILGDFSLGCDLKELEMIYKDATKQKFDFLKVDVDSPDANKKFSHNWSDFYHIEQDEFHENDE